MFAIERHSVTLQCPEEVDKRYAEALTDAFAEV